MSDAIEIRPITPRDADAWRALSAQSADAGRIRIAPLYHVDPYRAMLALEPDSAGFVAAAPGVEGLIGAAFVTFGRRLVAGQETAVAELHSLQVHPAYRRRGIGWRLVEARLALIRAHLGDEAVILASVQEGNAGSLALDPPLADAAPRSAGQQCRSHAASGPAGAHGSGHW